ncbi:hypothetical protein KESI111651_04425 [Kerstersia similis]
MTATETRVSSALTALKRTAGAALGGFSLMAGINMADDWGQYASRIRQVTQSVEEYEHVQARLVESARDTFRSLAETREGFIQMTPVLRDMGLNLDQSIDAIDTFSGLLVVNSATSDQGKRAMEAYSKSLIAGKIDADSWKSVVNAMPSVIDLLSVSLGRSADEVRRLGKDGEISVRDFSRTLVSSNQSVKKAVEDMPTTVKDALGRMGDAFGEYLGRQNEARGVTAALASSINHVTDNFGLLADVAIPAAGGLMLAYAVKTMRAAAETRALGFAKIEEVAASRSSAAAAHSLAVARVAEAKATLAAAASEREKLFATSVLANAERQLAASSTALSIANRTLYSSLLGLVGGPMGALTLGLGVAGAAWGLFSNRTSEARKSLLDTEEPLESITQKFERMGEVTQRDELAKALKQRQEAAEEADKAFENLEASMRVGMFANYSDWQKYRDMLDEARKAGTSLAPVLDQAAQAAGVPKDAVARWMDYAKVVEAADGRTKGFTVVVEALTGVVERLRGAATGAGDALASLTPEQYEAKRTEWLGKYATDAEKLSAKLAEAKKEFGGLIPADVEKRIRASFAPKGSAASKQINEGQRYIKQINERISLIGKETEFEKLQAQISVGAIKFKTDAKRKEAEAAARALDKANASLRLTEMQREIDMIGLVTEADKMRYEVTKGLYAGFESDIKKHLVLLAAESDEKSRQIDFNKTLLSLQGERADAERQFFREIEAFGRGDQYRGLLDSLAQVEDKYRQIMRERRNSPAGLSAGEQAAIEQARDAELERERERYAVRLALQADWVSGATRGLENYFDSARNVSSGIEGLFGNAFSKMEDFFAKSARGIKVSASDLIDSLIEDSMRLAARQSITGPLASALGGAISSAFGSMSSNWSSTNTSNPWSLSSLGVYDVGGYTGDGGRLEPAGLVHKGEGVLNQDEIRALGGEEGFNALRRAIRGPGHAVGGMAGYPRLPMSASSSQPNINVNLHGVQSQPESVTATRNQSGGFDIDIMFKQVEKRMASNVASGQGSMSKALERRYALTPQLG